MKRTCIHPPVYTYSDDLIVEGRREAKKEYLRSLASISFFRMFFLSMVTLTAANFATYYNKTVSYVFMAALCAYFILETLWLFMMAKKVRDLDYVPQSQATKSSCDND